MIVDPGSTSARDLYRLMIRTVVPRPIAWVSTVSSRGRHNLAPFSFFMAISAEPPLLAFAPGRRPEGGPKDTLANVEETREFVVNVVTEDLAEKMNDTATPFPRGTSEFEEAGLTPVASERVRPPRVGESPVAYECELYDTISFGPGGAGGTLVIGEIVLVHVEDRVIRDGRVDAGLLAPVGRLGGMEYAYVRDRFVMPRKPYEPDAR